MDQAVLDLNIAIYKLKGYRCRRKTLRSGPTKGQRAYWIVDSGNAPADAALTPADSEEKAWVKFLNGSMTGYFRQYTYDLNYAWTLLLELPAHLQIVILHTPRPPHDQAYLIAESWWKWKRGLWYD